MSVYPAKAVLGSACSHLLLAAPIPNLQLPLRESSPFAHDERVLGHGGVALVGQPLDVGPLSDAALPLPHHTRHLLLQSVALPDLK